MPAPEQTTGSLRPRTPISDLLRVLEARREVTVRRRADYLDVRAGGDGGVGLYVHDDRVSIAVAPERGYELEARAPFALQIPRTPAVAYVVVAADGVGSYFDEVLGLALDALDWRACGRSAEFCAHCGVGCSTWHDTCPNCWLEVDEQGCCGCTVA